MGSVIAAGSAYATHGEHMIPVYVFYSMFGFQRTGDQMWQLADQMGRGFLLGATAGRTTLNGEGLQHEDGHSPLLASVNPGAVVYDPAWAFEIAHIVKDGLRRMYGEQPESIFYYLTVYNEPYPQPAEPQGVDVEGILRGVYRFAPAEGQGRPRANILASGVAGRWALEAQRLLAEDWGVDADVWSATSWSELRRDALAAEEHNLLNPDAEPRVPYVTRALSQASGPFVGVSDYMRAVPDQIAQWVPGDWTALGTDGFGLSDTRSALRRHFHVDAASITLAVLTRLAKLGEIKPETLREAIARYHLKNGVTEVGAQPNPESNETQSMGF
jgi:pyruvate dehydrogenase E1 component